MTPPADPTALADRVHSAAIHLLRLLRKQDAATGITPSRLSALSVVVFAGPVTLGQLAQAEQVSAPTMTRLVVGLEKDGLIRRERDVTDARVVWIHPTAKGDRILREGRRRRVAELARALEQLSPREVAELDRGTQIIEQITHRPTAALLGSTASPRAATGASRVLAQRRKR
ncbi:MAG TPA: MarR family transcriptional regulator [Gemmatimonadaceae bacterium]|nr:MarR family transcriptional regulator [Gemmatimonadaceae bacterium]